MYVISSREFRDNQKRYLDLVDNNKLVIIQRGKNKAYKITAITDTDRFLEEPAVNERLAHSIAQAEKGEVTSLNKEDIDVFFGL